MGFIVCVSLILAGAVGNIIDSAFYGLIFNESYGQVARFFPDGGGYATFLHGKVVDMLYFPLISGHYPDWLPIIGGREFLFFRPVFNIADSSITIGIFSIIIFYWRLFSRLEQKKEETSGED
jgi:signal peptidase II